MNEKVSLKFNNSDGTNPLRPEEADLDSSPPASPIRSELVRFHSNSPGLKSLYDHYADIMPNISETSECDKSTDPLRPANEMNKDDQIDDYVQYFTAFVRF